MSTISSVYEKMNFCFISLLVLLLLWTVGFYPVSCLGEEHLRCFFVGGALVLSGNILSYSLFHWGYSKESTDFFVRVALGGAIIRMVVVLSALLIASRIDIDLEIFAPWTLGFYFFFLFYETIYLMREVQSL